MCLHLRYAFDIERWHGMIDIDLLVIEKIKEQQRQRELEEGRRLWLPIPEPELKPQPKEQQREPKRVIEIQL